MNHQIIINWSLIPEQVNKCQPKPDPIAADSPTERKENKL